MASLKKRSIVQKCIKLAGKLLVSALLAALFARAFQTSLTIHANNESTEPNVGENPQSISATTTTNLMPTRKLELFAKEISTGILSAKPREFFQNLQQQIDQQDSQQRCQVYGYRSLPNHIPKRRLFLGSLIADEPWELVEIVATESHGIYSGVVFVESNRTQNFDPRPLRRFNQPEHIQKLKDLYGVPQLQVRLYVNEKPQFTGIRREHAQRQEILAGWLEMGMNYQDIGIIADADETFTRDFLRAAQECVIPNFDYNTHECYTSKVKLAASSMVFETSPECVTAQRGWYHPEMILGHCIEMIGNTSSSSVHPLALRDGPRRAHGWGRACSQDFSKIPGRHPLWSAADFRMLCGRQATLICDSNHLSNYTGFHLHNFFTNLNSTRTKYHTYGHAIKARRAFSMPLEEMGKADLQLMVRCVRDVPDEADQKWKRVVGGLNASRPPIPLYFHDYDYVRRRHEWIQEQVRLDDEMVAAAKDQWG